jgi:excinuclease ABC subunit B
MAQTSVLDIKGYDPDSPYAVEEIVTRAAEEEPVYTTIPQLEKIIARTKKEMEKAARDLDFMEAARLRDEMFSLQKKLEQLKTS